MAKEREKDSLERISSDFQSVEREYHKVLTALFARLEKADPELFKLAMEVFGKPEVAIIWFSTARRDLQGKAPFEGLGTGKRQVVWNAIGRFISGSFG